MKKIAFVSIMAAMIFAGLLPSCKKSKTDSEPILVVEITPANKSNNLNILGPDFPLKVEITSAIPASGVKIEVTASPEGTATTAFFTATNNTSAPQNNYTITNTPSGVTCVVNVTVTSLSQPANIWKGTYLYSKK
ncbi:MAG: hypothetical protein ABIR15_15580 [Chitinophagaceae bacterium]